MVKRTFQPKKGKAKKTSGYRARMKSYSGKKVIKRRRQKGRKKYSL